MVHVLFHVSRTVLIHLSSRLLELEMLAYTRGNDFLIVGVQNTRRHSRDARGLSAARWTLNQRDGPISHGRIPDSFQLRLVKPISQHLKILSILPVRQTANGLKVVAQQPASFDRLIKPPRI